MKNLRVAVIGHLDHGKSTLLGRLLFDSGQVKPEKIKEVKKISRNSQVEYSFFLDNLEEERLGGMTIDVFYARYKSPRYEYTFIDTPGHKEFIKNMLSGTSNAEAAVLVVSAAPGERIQNQTRQHLRLAKLLGITQLAVVINKMDLVDYQKRVFKKISDETRSLLKNIGFEKEKIPFVPVSARGGINVLRKSQKTPWYQGESFIQELDNNFKPSPSFSYLPLRFLVQDVYSFAGQKTPVGRVETGILKKGLKIVFEPSRIKTQIKAIKVGERLEEEAKAGEVVGVVLADKTEKVEAGQVGGTEKFPPNVCQEFLAQVYLLAGRKIKAKEEFQIRCGTAEERCQIKKVFQRKGGFVKLKIATSKPMVIEKVEKCPPLSRFILLQKNKTLALGIKTTGDL